MNKIVLYGLYGSATILAFVAGMMTGPEPIQKNKVSHSTKPTIIKVIDGDTIKITAPFLPAPLKPQLLLRIYGVDTPEKGHRAKCDLERMKAHKAKQFVVDSIARGTTIEVYLTKWDKYGGRILGDVIIDGKSLKNLLVDNKLAIEYDGDRKVHNWCK